MAEFSCNYCDKKFKKIGKLNFHEKDCHPQDEDTKKCPLCNKIFASVSIRQRHEQTGCPKERKIVWIPPEDINKEKINNRHVNQRSELTDNSLEIITMFRQYLTAGSTSTFMLSRGKQQLEKSSVESYVSHFRVYLAFVENAETDCDVIDCFLRVKTIKDYIVHLTESDYCKKTILNRLLALERFCGFVEEKIEDLGLHNLTSRKRTKPFQKMIIETLEWLNAQIKVYRPIATKETLTRNSRESYEQEGRWISPQKLFAKEQELREHIDTLISQCEANPNQRPSMADIQAIQRFLLFVLVIRRPPMRAQNFQLLILEKVENPKEAKNNAVVFEENEVILQYSQYKTKATYGFTKFYLSEFLAKYVKNFVHFVRPWFFAKKEDVPLYGSSLFLNQLGKPLQNVGSYFIETMQQYFGQRIEISTIRKIMETAVSDCSLLSDTDKDKLSTAMLHDPETAKRYYVTKDCKTESVAINAQWDKLYQHYNQGMPIASPATASQQNISGQTEAVSTVPSSSVGLELIPTSALCSPVKVSSVSNTNVIPSLVSSICNSFESDEETAEQIAEDIAQKFVTPSPISSPNKYPLKAGDWMCSLCNYTNFAYRIVCNRCGKGKNKRSMYEEDLPRKKPRTNEDIVAVIKKSTNKAGEAIYKVKSNKKGEVWVRAQHVPKHLL